MEQKKTIRKFTEIAASYREANIRDFLVPKWTGASKLLFCPQQNQPPFSGVYFMGVKDGSHSAGDKCLSEWPSPGGGGGRQGRVFFNPTPLTGRHTGRTLFVLCHVRDCGRPGVMTGHAALVLWVSAALFMQYQPFPPSRPGPRLFVFGVLFFRPLLCPRRSFGNVMM